MTGRRITGYLVATVGTAVLVLVLLPARDRIDALSMGWAFLAVVVLAAAVGGVGPGIAASVAGFAAYNYFFFPPYETFRVAEPEHLVVLVAFLAISTLVAVLLAAARARAAAAEARADELRLQQDLAMALVDPTPDVEGRYDAVLSLLADSLDLRGVDLYVTPETGSGLELRTQVGDLHAAPDAVDLERVPLIVGRRSLGLLVAKGAREPLSPAERRILLAFGNQLALLLERDRVLRASVAGQRGATEPADPA